MSFVKTGSPKQAKYAVRCIDAMCRSKDVIFKQLFEVDYMSDYQCNYCSIFNKCCAPIIFLLMWNITGMECDASHCCLSVICKVLLSKTNQS